MAKDISSRYGDSMSMEDLEEWTDDNVDDPHMIEMDELARAVEEIGVDIHHSDDYDGQPSSYDEYQDLYGGDDSDHGQFDSFEAWADDTVDTALQDETIEEAYMKEYKKYHCKDCADTMHTPTTTCGHDSHDESGSWWRDENGNGVPDVMENKTPGDSHYNKERAMDMLKKKGITNPTYGELMAAIKQIEMGESEEEKQMPITEFVLSMYDRQTGQFPTAILTSIEKDYGEQYITPAKKFIEAINSKYEQMMTKEPEANTELDSILQLSGQKY